MKRRGRLSDHAERGCTVEGCENQATATVVWVQDGRRFGRRMCADHAAGKAIQLGPEQVNVSWDRVE